MGLTMPHSPAQTRCGHWGLGRFRGGCGEGAGRSMRDTLLVEALLLGQQKVGLLNRRRDCSELSVAKPDNLGGSSTSQQRATLASAA
ncbi:protein of unknown function [Cyanobium sp. NIES-981]|nr:protein of unknown function [Cyanobium sp. NIES-981]